MSKILTISLLSILMAIYSHSSFSEGWCSFPAGGFTLVTHGTKSESAYVIGAFSGETVAKWVGIANSSYGKNNIALALAAQISEKSLSVYIDDSETCSTFTSWSDKIRHVKINN